MVTSFHSNEGASIDDIVLMMKLMMMMMMVMVMVMVMWCKAPVAE